MNSNCRYRFSKLSYDSIMLGFAIETGCEALLPRTAFLARFSFCRWKRRSQNGAASHWNPAAESVAMWRMPEKASFERCDSSAEPALVFRTIKATRLSVANYNTTLSSESLETGTGSSNSLRSAKQSRKLRRVGHLGWHVKGWLEMEVAQAMVLKGTGAIRFEHRNTHSSMAEVTYTHEVG